MSYPTLVPSRSIDVPGARRRRAPQPSGPTTTASTFAVWVAEWLKTSYSAPSPFALFASIATTTHCDPKTSASLVMSPGPGGRPC